MEIALEAHGCLLALSRDDAKRLFAIREPGALLDLIRQLRGELANSSRHCEVEQHWTMLHRCLSDGSLDITAGEPPGNMALLGGRHLYPADDGYVVVVRPDLVGHIAQFLGERDEAWLSGRLAEIDDTASVDAVELASTLKKIQSLYQTAAAEQCCVVFAAVESQ